MNDLPIWTIYDRPSDYPHNVVARKFLVTEQGAVVTNEMFVADNLDEVRELLPPGLVCLARQVDDDKNIVETWL